MSKLTPRERQVVEMLICGMAPKEIARNLGISPNTAATYIKRARKRTDSDSAVELAVKCAFAFHRHKS